jgi:hypothetical protein
MRTCARGAPVSVVVCLSRIGLLQGASPGQAVCGVLLRVGKHVNMCVCAQV